MKKAKMFFLLYTSILSIMLAIDMATIVRQPLHPPAIQILIDFFNFPTTFCSATIFMVILSLTRLGLFRNFEADDQQFIGTFTPAAAFYLFSGLIGVFTKSASSATHGFSVGLILTGIVLFSGAIVIYGGRLVAAGKISYGKLICWAIFFLIAASGLYTAVFVIL